MAAGLSRPGAAARAQSWPDTFAQAPPHEPGTRSGHDDDAAEDLAPFHPVEGLLDLVEGDGLADEAVQVEPALQIEVDQQREVPARQAVAVPGRLEGAAAAE